LIVSKDIYNVTKKNISNVQAKILKINQYIHVLSHIKHAAQLFSTLIIVRNVS